MESAVILAGGKSTRMGRNKALLDLEGETLIGRVYRILKKAFSEVLISANDVETYGFLGAPIVRDAFAAGGSLAGIHAGLLNSRGEHCFFLACDMPFVNIELIQYLNRFIDDYDVVIPVSRSGPEPLHSFYSRHCIPYIEEQLESGNLKIIDFFHRVRMREVSVEEMREYDPEELSYFNINTREKFERAKSRLREQKMGQEGDP
jgi:molybdopterin-guanine dinucleotide biosynthesis protein A